MDEANVNFPFCVKQRLLMKWLEQQGMDQIPVKRYWNFGFQTDVMLRTVKTLPPELFYALQQLLDLLHLIAADTTCQLQQTSRLSGYSGESNAQSSLESIKCDEEEVFRDERLEIGLIRVLTQ